MSTQESKYPYDHGQLNLSRPDSVLVLARNEKLSNEFLASLDQDSAALCIFMEEFGVASSADIKSLVEKMQSFISAEYPDDIPQISKRLYALILLYRFDLENTLASLCSLGSFLTLGLLSEIQSLDGKKKLDLNDLILRNYVPNPDWSVASIRLFYKKLAYFVNFCSKFVYAEVFSVASDVLDLYGYVNSKTNDEIGEIIRNKLESSQIMKRILDLYQEIINLDESVFVIKEGFEDRIRKLMIGEMVAGITLLSKTCRSTPPSSPTGFEIKNSAITNERGEVIYDLSQVTLFSQNQFVDSDGRVFRKNSACPFAKKLQPIDTKL